VGGSCWNSTTMAAEPRAPPPHYRPHSVTTCRDVGAAYIPSWLRRRQPYMSSVAPCISPALTACSCTCMATCCGAITAVKECSKPQADWTSGGVGINVRGQPIHSRGRVLVEWLSVNAEEGVSWRARDPSSTPLEWFPAMKCKRGRLPSPCSHTQQLMMAVPGRRLLRVPHPPSGSVLSHQKADQCPDAVLKALVESCGTLLARVQARRGAGALAIAGVTAGI